MGLGEMREKELEPKHVRWLSRIGAVLSELSACDGSDSHTSCILQIRHQIPSKKEYHERSSWALVRSTVPLLSSAACPCHTCDLGISSDERHGHNGQSRGDRMVDATWGTAEIHLHNLQLLVMTQGLSIRCFFCL